jgi:thymidylate synthase (FAD)
MDLRIDVLDKGYVRLVDVMGSDLSVANAARASYAKEVSEFSDKDAKLISFLARENHMSPFRHAFMTLEFKAPLMVARQHWKYVVGSDHTMDSWNESSRRYVTSDPDFYIIQDNEWRSQAETNKQGSGETISEDLGGILTEQLINVVDAAIENYNNAISLGVCGEQARAFLPAYNLYVNYRWSCSLQSVCLFLKQRLEEGSQSEIADYAKAVYGLVQPSFPVVIKELVGDMTDYHWGAK